jgi:hypothetical protein
MGINSISANISKCSNISFRELNELNDPTEENEIVHQYSVNKDHFNVIDYKYIGKNTISTTLLTTLSINKYNQGWKVDMGLIFHMSYDIKDIYKAKRLHVSGRASKAYFKHISDGNVDMIYLRPRNRDIESNMSVSFMLRPYIDSLKINDVDLVFIFR